MAQNSAPFELLGFSIEEFNIWCYKHSLRKYEAASKKLFFKLVYEGRIKKREGVVYEDGEKIS